MAVAPRPPARAQRGAAIHDDKIQHVGAHQAPQQRGRQPGGPNTVIHSSPRLPARRMSRHSSNHSPQYMSTKLA
ncbi:hypothetical protein CSQ96_08000 [Janthinobacterium sp. BJB412]|nr:hypothetical protein CSQ96_08000 [Janthinobacterium sp. BJB412]